MQIAVTGLSGFIGQRLKRALESDGHQVTGIPHRDLKEESRQLLIDKLTGCDAVINLAGASINGRWTRRRKQNILHSRIDSTRLLVSAINALPQPPEVFISASAIGYYSTQGIHTEESTAAQHDFLSEVCIRWEEEAKRVNPAVRQVILRFGLILGPEGGMLPRVINPAKKGVHLIFGNGHQPFSWIHIEDLLRIIDLALSDKQLSGVINCVAPDTLTWRDLISEMKEHYPGFMTVHLPEWLLWLFFLDGAHLLTHGQQVVPQRLLNRQFLFKYPELQHAISGIIAEKEFSNKHYSKH